MSSFMPVRCLIFPDPMRSVIVITLDMAMSVAKLEIKTGQLPFLPPVPLTINQKWFNCKRFKSASWLISNRPAAVYFEGYCRLGLFQCSKKHVDNRLFLFQLVIP
jgi:hypothetical protein